MGKIEVVLEKDGCQFDLTLKNVTDLENVPQGKRIILSYRNGYEYDGYFQFMDDDIIVLKSVDSSSMLGFPTKNLIEFFQEK